MIENIKNIWKVIKCRWQYKPPLKEGQVGYFKYGWTMVFLERVKKLEGGMGQISLLSKLSARHNSLADL